MAARTRANTLLADVPLHDVWAVDLPGLREGVALEDVLRRADRDVFRTVHAAALSAPAKTADGYRYYFAVYAVSGGWITPLSMALIDPFRRWIIYPALLKNIRAASTSLRQP